MKFLTSEMEYLKRNLNELKQKNRVIMEENRNVRLANDELISKQSKSKWFSLMK